MKLQLSEEPRKVVVKTKNSLIQRKSVGFSQIKDWKNSEKEVLIEGSHDNIEIVQAKEIQLKNWITHNVHEEVEDK